MSIQRLFNNENKVIANKSVIDHNELANRDQYGCHTIQAIRKLPEKLTELKDKDLELTEKIDAASGELTNQLEAINANTSAIQEVKENAQKIDIVENQEDGTFTFTNYNNESKTIQSGYQPDEDTLTLTEDDKLALKRVYVDTELIGTGAKDDALRLNLGSTITKDSLGTLNSTGLYINDDTVLTAEQINNKLISLETKDTETDSEIEKIKSENTDQNNKIYNLETVTKGMGGYLNSYNFEKATPTQDELTNYALQEIGITDKTKIFNGTKVINEFDKNLWRLDNTPNTDPIVFTWENLGQVQETSIATLDLLGLVKGSTEKLKGTVDLTGEISINNLEEELANKASLTEENTFNGKNNFNAETNFNSAVTVQNIEQNGNPVYGILSGTTDPTTETAGKQFQFYVNTTSKKLFQCMAVTTTEEPITTTYEWQVVGSETLAEAIRDNTTQIVGDNKSFKAGGASSVTGNWCIGIGYMAKARGTGGIAIGANTEGAGGVALGLGASAIGLNTYQLGVGSNFTSHSFQIEGDNIYKADTHTLKVQNAEINGTKTYGVLQGTADPTNATVGGVSQFYLNTTDKKLWQCVAITTDESTSTTSYEWQPVGAGVSQEDFDKLVNNETQIVPTSGGLAIGGANKPSSYESMAIGYRATTSISSSTAIGTNAKSGFQGTAIGNYADASVGTGGTALGRGATTTANYAIQLGLGTNNTANSFQIENDNIYKTDTHTLTVQNIELNGVDLGTQLGDINTALEKILGV